MSETKEYTDLSTGVRLTVEYDIPEHPKISIFWSENDNLEEINEAIRRLMTSAGFPPAPSQGGREQ